MSSCASNGAPVAYCPHPPIPGPTVVESILNNAGNEGNYYLNVNRKYLCKYWQVYDKAEFKENCE